MPSFGDGRALMVTGSTHNPQGFRKVDDPEIHDALVTRLMRKTLDHVDDIVETEEYFLDDAEIAFFAYGISARSALAATRRLRDRGLKVGLLRTKTIWPFPQRLIEELSGKVSALVVPELNKGMMASVTRGFSSVPVHAVTQTNGKTIKPERLIAFAEELS